MKKEIRKKIAMNPAPACRSGIKKKKSSAISYRIKCKRTANGLSHYVPADKKALV